jgi:hypothetical protein
MYRDRYADQHTFDTSNRRIRLPSFNRKGSLKTERKRNDLGLGLFEAGAEPLGTNTHYTSFLA